MPKKEGELFYINSMSCRTIAYKGLLMPTQLETFFPDLTDERIATTQAHPLYRHIQRLNQIRRAIPAVYAEITAVALAAALDVMAYGM